MASKSSDTMMGKLRNLFPGIGIEGGLAPDSDENLTEEEKAAKAAEVAAALKAKEVEDGEKSKDPLAAFAEIFDNKKPAGTPEEDIPLSMQAILTPENLKKITAELNFAEMISPEVRKKLADPETASAAMFEAMNEIALGSYTTAIQHSSRASELVLDDRMQRMEKTFSARIDDHQIKSSIKANEAIANSPVLQAGIMMIADQLRKSQPDADPKWVTEQATKFFAEAGKTLGGGDSSQSDGSPGSGDGDKEGTDWLQFATTGQPDGSDSSDGGDSNQ